jgi:DNA-directed RNA polymerase subunit M/transcription elongation factor TFIIS
VKVQCARCKEVVALGRFAVVGDAIEVTCPECGQVYRIGSETGQEVSPPAQPSPGEREGDRCPKCDKPVPKGAEACPACGLGRPRFAAFSAEPADEPAAVAAAWAECRARWTEPETHDRFLDAVTAAQAFDAGARRYREVLRESPADERARQGLARVRRRAEAALLAAPVRAKGPAGPEPYKNVVLLLLVLVALGGIFGIYALFRARNAQSEPDPGAPRPEQHAPLKHSTPGHRR